MTPLRVLVACEISGVVRDAFRDRGHDAWSCDLLGPADVDMSDQRWPGYHLRGDVLATLFGGWDMMIAFPPCTHLAVSGARYFAAKREAQAAAIAFVKRLLDAPIPAIAVENPIGVLSSRLRKPDQIIQPYEFGHDASKATCLWLKNLVRLAPTHFIEPRRVNGRSRWANQTDTGQNRLAPSPDRAARRSRTYQGIADAMARTWGELWIPVTR